MNTLTKKYMGQGSYAKRRELQSVRQQQFFTPQVRKMRRVRQQEILQSARNESSEKREVTQKKQPNIFGQNTLIIGIKNRLLKEITDNGRFYENELQIALGLDMVPELKTYKGNNLTKAEIHNTSNEPIKVQTKQQLPPINPTLNNSDRQPQEKSKQSPKQKRKSQRQSNSVPIYNQRLAELSKQEDLLFSELQKLQKTPKKRPAPRRRLQEIEGIDITEKIKQLDKKINMLRIRSKINKLNKTFKYSSTNMLKFTKSHNAHKSSKRISSLSSNRRSKINTKRSSLNRSQNISMSDVNPPTHSNKVTMSQYDNVPRTVQMTRLFSMIKHKPGSKYDGSDTEMDEILQDVDEVIKICAKQNYIGNIQSKLRLPKLPGKNYLRSLSSVQFQTERFASTYNKLPDDALISFYQQVKAQPRQQLTARKPPRQKKRIVKVPQKSKSVTRLKRDKSFVSELERINEMKQQLPGNVCNSYLSNANLYRSAMLSRESAVNRSLLNSSRFQLDSSMNSTFRSNSASRVSGKKVIPVKSMQPKKKVTKKQLMNRIEGLIKQVKLGKRSSLYRVKSSRNINQLFSSEVFLIVIMWVY